LLCAVLSTIGRSSAIAAALAVDHVRPRRERDVAAVAAAPFPDGEADQLQPFQRAVAEMQLRFGELSGGFPLSFGVILIVMAGTQHQAGAGRAAITCRRKRAANVGVGGARGRGCACARRPRECQPALRQSPRIRTCAIARSSVW
jgi:hypothetical protein